VEWPFQNNFRGFLTHDGRTTTTDTRFNCRKTVLGLRSSKICKIIFKYIIRSKLIYIEWWDGFEKIICSLLRVNFRKRRTAWTWISANQITIKLKELQKPSSCLNCRIFVFVLDVGVTLSNVVFILEGCFRFTRLRLFNMKT